MISDQPTREELKVALLADAEDRERRFLAMPIAVQCECWDALNSFEWPEHPDFPWPRPEGYEHMMYPEAAMHGVAVFAFISKVTRTERGTRFKVDTSK